MTLFYHIMYIFNVSLFDNRQYNIKKKRLKYNFIKNEYPEILLMYFEKISKIKKKIILE